MRRVLVADPDGCVEARPQREVDAVKPSSRDELGDALRGVFAA